MPYGREWDQGKPYGGGHGHVRPREDDGYAGGSNKRHKHNNDYDDDGYAEDYSYDDRRREQGHRRRLVPSEATQHVIFLGLDQDFTEADLQAYLLGLGGVLNNVTIIRDRATGLSKGFGFAEFATVEHASAFLKPRFPFIHVPPPASHGTAAYYAWQAAMDAGTLVNQRRVKIDFSQSANPTARPVPNAHGPVQINDGTRDIGTAPAPVLLFRGLDPISAPEAIAAACRHSAGLDKDGAPGLRRVVLVKDKMTKASWGFAFVEFVDTQSASAVLGNTMSPQLHPEGFRVSDRPVAVSFAHPYSWQKVPDNVIKDEACIASTVALGGVDGDWTRYWDEASTVAVLEFDVKEPTPKVQAGPVKKEKDRRKKEELPKNVDAEVAAFLGSMNSELTAVVGMPVSDKPLTLSFSKPTTTTTTKAAASAPPQPVGAPVLGFSLDDAEEPAVAAEDVDKGPGGVKAATSKKVAPLIASKKVANDISRWTSVQGELNPGGKQAEAAPSASTSTLPSATPAPKPKVAAAVQAKKVAPPAAPPASASASGGSDEFEFGNATTFACLLCSRALKSLDQLKRHNVESDLHKARTPHKNLKDAALRDVAREKAAAAKAKQAAEQAPKYRDRALERRAMHGQPDVPLPDPKAAPAKKRADGPPPPPSPPPPPIAPAKDENNIGNKLLKKMGWSEGTGLGTDGEGRVDPIETAMFETGAGIGASKGVEIGKYTGYSGYVAKAKDSVRDRYNNGGS
ncbi:hypothetical protein AURDEDRAFT_180890 [Auricularia subglabra TFB-10046 SS5]|nr:hypothetical protein AURDEDRAFT_180890 [Auricularia subglabra TFB-10046 SS5]